MAASGKSQIGTVPDLKMLPAGVSHGGLVKHFAHIPGVPIGAWIFRRPGLSLGDHAQDPDLRAGMQGGELIAGHGFGQHSGEHGRPGTDPLPVAQNFVTHIRPVRFAGLHGKNADLAPRMPPGDLIHHHRLRDRPGQHDG